MGNDVEVYEGLGTVRQPLGAGGPLTPRLTRLSPRSDGPAAASGQTAGPNCGQNSGQSTGRSGSFGTPCTGLGDGNGWKKIDFGTGEYEGGFLHGKVLNSAPKPSTLNPTP